MSDSDRVLPGKNSQSGCGESSETLSSETLSSETLSETASGSAETDEIEQLARRFAGRFEQWEREQDFAAEPAGENWQDGDLAPDTEAVPVPPHPGVVQVPPRNRRQVGKYEIRRPLGEGGQATTHLAWDPDLERHVVLKIYRQAADADEGAAFEEGRALVRVRSAHVARCLHLERLDGAPHLVMEYVPGRDLAHRQQPQPPLEHVVRWMRQVAEGLAAVHARGLIHRDVKPANIIVGDDGDARLVDLGLAAPIASRRLENTSGTAPYMAPEQARGEAERVDPRSDLFSWGVVLYELLAGQPPFPARSLAEGKVPSDLADRVDPVEPPSPRDVRSEVPEPLALLCRQCLAPSPEQRPASASEVAARMRDVERRLQPRPLAPRWGLLVAAVLTASPLLGLAAWSAWRPTTGPALASDTDRETGIETETGTGTDASVVADAKGPRLTDLPTSLPDGRSLRQDFPLHVRLNGATQAADGVVQLTAGQALQVEVLAERDCFLTVVSIEQGSDNQLFPNRAEPDAFLAAGTRRLIPGRPTVAGVEQQELIATPSSTVEYILVVATNTPWQSGGAYPAGNYQAFVEPAERQQWRERLRGLKLQPRRTGQAPAMDVAEVLIPYRVGPASQP